jgi:hypothetical protein
LYDGFEHGFEVAIQMPFERFRFEDLGELRELLGIRLEAVLRLASEGVDVAVAAIPWIPEVTNIEAIIEAVPDTVPILVGPLDVQPDVIGPGRISKRYDRQKVNDAYLAERDRIGKLDHVAWRPPTGLPGTQEGIDGGEIYSHTGKVAFKFLVRNRNVPRDDFASGPVSN